MYPIKIGFVFVLQGKLAKYSGLPPAKIQRSNFMSKIDKKHPKPYEINIPNSDWMRLGFVRVKCAKYLGRPPAKMKKKQLHKQNQLKRLQNPMKSMSTMQIGFVFGHFG